MSIIVEDGTGLSTANSYATETEADTFHSDKGNTAWASATSAQKEAALTYATRYIDSLRFPGSIKVYNQSLKWPRYSAYDSEGRLIEGVPVKVKEAVFALALHYVNEGSIEPNRSDVGETKREKVGPLETEYFRFTGRNRFPFIDRILDGITVPKNRLMRV